MKTVVIGAGSIGNRYARLLGSKCDVAVLDHDQALAESVADATGAVALSSFQDLLGWQPDAVVVATPASSHCELARRLAGQVRLLLIEKPLSSTIENLDDLSEELTSSGTTARVVSNMRFHPGPSTVNANLHRLGQIYCARAHFGQWLPSMRPHRDYREMYCASVDDGGGVIFDCIHELDYMAWMLGTIESSTASAEKLSDLQIGAPDWSNLELRHAGGAISVIHLDYLQRHQRRGCEIIGRDGTLIWTNEGTTPFSCQVRFFDPGQDQWHILLEETEMQPDDMYCKMLDLFLAGDPEGRLSSVSEAAAITRVAWESGQVFASSENGSEP